MKTESKQPIIQIHGNGYLIYFNENQVDDGYEYDTCEVSNSPIRREIIEAMIASRYTIGAEFAAINNKDSNPTGYAEYQAWRVICKGEATRAMEGL